MSRFILLLSILSCLAGCNRAVYTNLHGDRADRKVPLERIESLPDFEGTNWQHFFIYGLLPAELKIEAAKLCNGTEHIAAIKTKQTFAEGLVAMLAGYYINIYSPYDGHVVCDRHSAGMSNALPGETIGN